MKSRTLISILTMIPLAGLALSGCSSSTPEAQNDDAQASAASIIATTNVYGDIARNVAGENVEVKEVIDSAAQDPHSYEPTARDKLTVSQGSIVLANGGGFDAFMDSLYDSLPESDRDRITLIHAVDHSPVPAEHEAEEHEHDDHESEAHESEAHEHEGHAHAEYNEHIWYDLDSVSQLAQALADELAAQDASNAQSYKDNAASFISQVDQLQTRLEEAGLDDKTFMMTEPVPYHLAMDAHMKDVTPEGLSEAVEEGEDVPPLTLKKAEDALSNHEADVLLYNTQTEGAETQAVREAAEAAGVPVIDLAETITDDSSYLEWMSSNIDALSSAS